MKSKIFVLIVLLFPFWLTNCASTGEKGGTTIRVVHYNIKELDSHKLKNAANNSQLQAATKILKELKPDILSINEIQFDLPNVPTKEYQTKGKNMSRLLEAMSERIEDWQVTFNPANTGKNSRPMKNGQFAPNPGHPKWRKLADPVNFGIFPAQYSTGGAFKFPVAEKKIFADIKWSEFNPGRDFKSYKDGNGKSFDEKTLELFDKNFTDVLITIDDKPVHVILLHTVPAYGFGNPKTINLVRNQDQLAFLEWYITGKTYFEVPKNFSIQPLKPGARVIAIGDWNVDITNQEAKGSEVLKRLQSHKNFWLSNFSYTYESGRGGQPKPFRAQFDYMLVSDHFKVKQAKVHIPEGDVQQLGCKEMKPPAPPEGYLLQAYTTGFKKDKKRCFAFLKKDYYRTKVASDHFPLWAEITLIK